MSIEERQSKLEGSHEQMDKRIDSSENWMRHHSTIIVALLGVIAATIVTALIKIAFFTPLPPTP